MVLSGLNPNGIIAWLGAETLKSELECAHQELPFESRPKTHYYWSTFRLHIFPYETRKIPGEGLDLLARLEVRVGGLNWPGFTDLGLHRARVRFTH